MSSAEYWIGFGFGLIHASSFLGEQMLRGLLALLRSEILEHPIAGLNLLFVPLAPTSCGILPLKGFFRPFVVGMPG